MIKILVKAYIAVTNGDLMFEWSTGQVAVSNSDQMRP